MKRKKERQERERERERHPKGETDRKEQHTFWWVDWLKDRKKVIFGLALEKEDQVTADLVQDTVGLDKGTLNGTFDGGKNSFNIV